MPLWIIKIDSKNELKIGIKNRVSYFVDITNGTDINSSDIY